MAAGRSEPGGWHMDTAFLLKHYATTPQTNVCHILTALNDVPSDGAAFQIVPAGFAQSSTGVTMGIRPCLMPIVTLGIHGPGYYFDAVWYTL